MKIIADNGLPLKIKADWTDNNYWENRGSDDLKCVNVAGWRIRINGVKYPRGNYGDDGIDWSYRYIAEHDKEGKLIAINRALKEAGLKIAKNQLASPEE